MGENHICVCQTLRVGSSDCTSWESHMRFDGVKGFGLPVLLQPNVRVFASKVFSPGRFEGSNFGFR